MNKNKVVYLVLFMAVGMLTFNSCKKDDNCTELTWYQDSDGDGYGNPGASISSCDQPIGYVSDNTDFDDANASAYPGATEICNDNIDNNGNSFIDCEDFACLNTTTIECNCSDGIDNDGDGFIDCDDFDCYGHQDC